jgi:hypothetical protein
VDQWTTEAVPKSQQCFANDAFAEAHQLRLQYVGEVLPIRAVTKGLDAILNSSSCDGVQILLHIVAAIDASMLAIVHHAHASARQLLQLSDVALSSVIFHHRASFETKLTEVIAKHAHLSQLSAAHQTCSDSIADLVVSANVLLPFLRAASNAIHFDTMKLQESVQIVLFKLCSVAITAQRLVAESQMSTKTDFPSLGDCYERGSRVCSEIRRSAIHISQACNSPRNCGPLQTALCNSESVHKLLSQLSHNEAAPTVCAQYALHLQLCSSVLRGQLEGCSAMHSQAVALLRLSWDLEALLMHGRCMLVKKLSLMSEPLLRQMFAASADMLDGDCELHGTVGGDSLTSTTWAPLLRKCSGYNKLLQNMRHGFKEGSGNLPGSRPSSSDALKKRSILLLYCVENRESRESSGARPVIDITDIKFPSPRRL